MDQSVIPTKYKEIKPRKNSPLKKKKLDQEPKPET